MIINRVKSTVLLARKIILRRKFNGLLAEFVTFLFFVITG
tara:strand:- start:224 stop:343 length:120 start_codon:yes stop_codon:yes gene_type:complete